VGIEPRLLIGPVKFWNFLTRGDYRPSDVEGWRLQGAGHVPIGRGRAKSEPRNVAPVGRPHTTDQRTIICKRTRIIAYVYES
jgi:hypothetical protein